MFFEFLSKQIPASSRLRFVCRWRLSDCVSWDQQSCECGPFFGSFAYGLQAYFSAIGAKGLNQASFRLIRQQRIRHPRWCCSCDWDRVIKTRVNMYSSHTQGLQALLSEPVRLALANRLQNSLILQMPGRSFKSKLIKSWQSGRLVVCCLSTRRRTAAPEKACRRDVEAG